MELGRDQSGTKKITQHLEGNTGTFMQLSSGTVLVDRYQVQDVVGIGGMGSVYRARDMHFPNVIKLVAVKEMINQSSDPIVRETIVRNFEREANILVTLNHPSIPKIYDFFSIDNRSYLVEEFINGRDLEAVLKSSLGPIKEDQVIIWSIQICDVLEYLHTHKPEPIIFRDIKPSNVMINQSNNVILVDFGIAKMFKTGQKGTMIGTEGYSPPEQYRGEATLQTDIYALGATMHHLLTHRDPRLEAPFSFADRPIRQINPAVSSDLETIVNNALEYNPANRFVSATDMKMSLLTLAKRTGALPRTASSTLTLSEQEVKPLWSFECEDEIRGTPTVEAGQLYVGAYDNNLYTLDATKGQFLWKFATKGGIVTKPLVCEGNLFFGSEDNKLYVLQARTGKYQWEYRTDGPIRCSPKISEGHVFLGSDDGNMYAINMTSYQKSWAIRTEGAVRSSPFLTQDLLYFGCESNEFICSDYRGNIKWRYLTKRPVTSSPLVSDGIVYFASLDSNFYALDAKSGWVIWRFRMGKGSVSSPALAENGIVFGSADNYLYCVDKSSSREIWRYKCDHQVSGSPLIYKESVYCGTASGCFYCIDYKTGRIRWKFNAGGSITGSATANNDVIYVGSTDHKIYAFIA
jgi:eukaryotic-like serine/threonine-protein kinase